MAYDGPVKMDRETISGHEYTIGKDIHIQQNESWLESANTYNLIQNYVHESFIHVQLDAEDLVDDGQENHSNVPPFPGARSRQHPYANDDMNSYFLKNEFPLLQKMNDNYNQYKTDQEVLDAMRDFIY